MNLPLSTSHSDKSHFSVNEDVNCDNEVNLIFESACSPRTASKHLRDQNHSTLIGEGSSAMAAMKNSVTDNSSLFFSSDCTYPSSAHLFNDYSFTMNSSDLLNLTDADLERFFVSSLTNHSNANQNNNNNNNNNPSEAFPQRFDEAFLNAMTDFVSSPHSSDQDNPVKPPPGFENFHSLKPQTSSSNPAAQHSNSTSDTSHFSQLSPSTIVGAESQQSIPRNLRSSASSSSTSDEQAVFNPRASYSHSPYATSQIYSPKTPSSTPGARHPLAHPSSLSFTVSANKHFFPTSRTSNSSVDHFQEKVPSFFPTDDHLSNETRTGSSSSSIDETLNHDPKTFHFRSTNFNSEQQALQDNLNFLASMATESTAVQAYHQENFLSNSSIQFKELLDNINEICYKGFDQLNALLQEQRWTENYLNISPSAKKLVHSNRSSAQILIVCEYFIYKCKKIQPVASQVFELLANRKMELHLKELIFVFQSWKETIYHAEQIHQDEEKKFARALDPSQRLYLDENVLQSAFSRLYKAIRQLYNLTEQTRAAYQSATFNVFQLTSRQTVQSSLTSIHPAQFAPMQEEKSSLIYHAKNPLHPAP